MAEAIPFAELTCGSHEALYKLKGEILSRGVRRVLEMELPVFPKRRFQHGALAGETFRSRFGVHPVQYRSHLLSLYHRR